MHPPQIIAHLARHHHLTEEQVRQHFAALDATSEANAEPLPGPLALAFPAQAIDVCGLKIRPFVAYDRIILRALDSPVHRQLLELSKPVEERKETEFSDTEGFELIWIFTHPCEEVAQALDFDLFNALGANLSVIKRREFRHRCVREIGFRLDATVASLAAIAISQQIARSISTALSYGKPAEGEKVFTTPPAEPATGLAGGSATSAESSAATPK